jgi:dUTP pyrophosphatase
MPEVRIQRLDPSAVLPEYAHAGDAGCDIRSIEHVIVAPGERVLVGTGLAIAVPPGYVCLVHPRSGLAIKHGITMLNAPGTIDAGYRGELKVIVINHDPRDSFEISPGDRIAQLVFQQVESAVFHEVADVTDDADRAAGEEHRGARGFGSSGRGQRDQTLLRSKDGAVSP